MRCEGLARLSRQTGLGTSLARSADGQGAHSEPDPKHRVSSSHIARHHPGTDNRLCTLSIARNSPSISSSLGLSPPSLSDPSFDRMFSSAPALACTNMGNRAMKSFLHGWQRTRARARGCASPMLSSPAIGITIPFLQPPVSHYRIVLHDATQILDPRSVVLAMHRGGSLRRNAASRAPLHLTST